MSTAKTFSTSVSAQTLSRWTGVERVERALVAAVIAFTIVAVVGFGLFSTPAGLSLTAIWLSESEILRQIHAIAFSLFAQGHVALTAALLMWHLSSRIGWPALSGFILIASITFAIEWVGTTTGFPFGRYGYGTALGPLIAGEVPIWIPVSWFTVAVPAYALARSTFSGNNCRVRRIVLGAFLVMLWDVTLDPAMSGLTGYWIWSETGVFFGVPLKNLLGWFLTGIVLMRLLELLGGAWWGRQLSFPFMRTYYGLLLALPAGMLIAAGEWGPLAVSLGLIGLALGVKEALRPRRVASRVDDRPAKTVSRDSARDFFWTHSRSFSFASLAFPRRQRRLVGLVYAFCRITDDIVDEAEAEAQDVHARLVQWLRDARHAYYGKTRTNDWLHEIMQTSRDHNVPFSVIEDLVRGVERDVNPPSFETVEDLKDYCYGVASTVGLWLCHLNDVRDEWMLDRAASLGRAMQITNIVRDVGEDLGRGRLYLPTELLQRHGLTESDLIAAQGDGAIPPSYPALMRDMMAIADQEYERAWEAIPRLPRGFAVPAAVAADVYRGIQRVVHANDYDNLTRRARTSLPRKIALATGAWCRLQWRRAGLRRRSTVVGFIVAVLIALAGLQSAATARPVDDEILSQLRSLYVEAGENRDAIDSAQTIIENLGDSGRTTPVVEAFAGAFEVVRAKHAFWPFSKLKHVKRGLPVLDRLVTEHPNDVEIRFLRLVSCYYLPGIMGRKDTVREDIQALCTTLPGAGRAFPDQWYRRMVGFVLESRDIEPPCRDELQGVLSRNDALPDSESEVGG